MLFSYYFDTEKTHLLNFRYRSLQFTELKEGKIEIVCSLEIAEVMNGKEKRKEVAVGTFVFPPASENSKQHDIDFARIRYGDQKKWIFTAVNNKDTTQKLTVGLISSTANKNPLGMDIINDEEDYENELKANNLSILEESYVPPVLKQTMVNARFDQPGYPEYFHSRTAKYDSTYKNVKLSEFTQHFAEPIPVHSRFEISMDLAPYEMPLKDLKVFDLNIPSFGCFTLNTNSMEWLIDGGQVSSIVRIFFTEFIKPEDFWNNGMTPNARLHIQGDGNGQVTIKYNGYTLSGTYNPAKSFNQMEFRGALARLDN